MRAGISQKQPPIIAYSHGTVKQYRDLTDIQECQRSTGVNSDGFPMKASAEMNSAIRRQKGTTGVDYWKTSNSTLSQPGHAKRATFQNVFFPALGMSRFSVSKGDSMVKARSNGTSLKQGLPEFTRAHTTSDMVPTGPEHRPSVQVRKAVVTDMTCLDSGESPHSGKSSQLAYFYQLYRAKFRYMDYIEHHGVDRSAVNDMPPKQANGHEEESTLPIHPRKPVKVIHSTRTLSIPNIRPTRRGGSDVKVSGHGTVKDVHVRRHEVVSMEVHARKQPVKHVLSDSTVITQTKKPTNKDLTITGTVFALNHSNSRGHNTSSNSHHGHSHGITNGSPREHPNVHFHGDVGYTHRTVRSASIPRVRLSRDDTSDGPRKRSVHFSRSNEVYEYKPTDPVKY